MRKMGSFVCLSCLLLKLWSWKCQKWLIYCTFCWWQQSVSHCLGIIFRCIWMILFSSFRKCYGLSNSNGNWQDVDTWKCWVLVFFADLTVCFYFYLQNLTNSNPKSYHFLNSVRSFIYTCPNCDFFCCHQQKIWKISHFRHFNGDNFGSRHDDETNDPIFFISSLSSIRCYIYFLHFQILKIQFHGAPFCIMFWYGKYIFHAKDYIFKPVNTEILFLHKIC